MKIIVEKIHEDAKLPERANPTDAGADLFCLEDVELNPLETKRVRTGIKVIVPQGYYLRLAEKSGLANKGISIGAGVIDSDYRGEIEVVMTFLSKSNKQKIGSVRKSDGQVLENWAEVPFILSKGSKICQAILEKIDIPDFVEGKVPVDTKRGEHGFGSTDKEDTIELSKL